MKDWKLEYDDGDESEYIKKFKWKNSEITAVLIKENESKITKEDLAKTFDKIIENIDYWIEKSKDKIVEEFIEYVNENDWIKPEYCEIYFENKSLEDVEKKLIEIIGKEDTQKIMKNNFLTKEAFRKILGYEMIEIFVESYSEENEFSIRLYESLFFTDKVFTLYWNLDGELIEFYMD